MKTTRETLRAMRETIRRGPDRSSLYWWMVDHHADLIDEGVAAGRMPWRKLCRDFAAEGLTDGRGKAATPARAGKTWRDACVAVAAAAERTKTAARENQPPPLSRSHSDWQPPIAETPLRPPALGHPREEATALPANRTPLEPPKVGFIAAAEQTEELTPHARAELEKMARMFKKTDRKRFGNL